MWENMYTDIMTGPLATVRLAYLALAGLQSLQTFVYRFCCAKLATILRSYWRHYMYAYLLDGMK